MITEDYVSFETAKLLKEKGFDEECRKRYASDDNEYIYDINELTLSYDTYADVEFYLCPTLQMAMKWLREVHKFNFAIDWNPTFKDYFVEIFRPIILCTLGSYKTYEEACDVAIRYCLNLI